MDYREIKIGGLYECTDLLGAAIRDWHRNEPTPSHLKVEVPVLNNGDLFVVLDVAVVKDKKNRNAANGALCDVKILSTKGDVGWLFLWTQYPFPAKEMVDTPETV